MKLLVTAPLQTLGLLDTRLLLLGRSVSLPLALLYLGAVCLQFLSLTPTVS